MEVPFWEAALLCANPDNGNAVRLFNEKVVPGGDPFQKSFAIIILDGGCVKVVRQPKVDPVRKEGGEFVGKFLAVFREDMVRFIFSQPFACVEEYFVTAFGRFSDNLAAVEAGSAGGSIAFTPLYVIFYAFLGTLCPFANYLVPDIANLDGPVVERQREVNGPLVQRQWYVLQ